MLKRIFAGAQMHPATRYRILTTVIFSVVILLTFSFFITAKTVYTITDGSTVTTVTSYFSSQDSILQTAGIALDPTDKVVSSTDDETPGLKIVRSQMISIQCDGAVIHILAYDETVSQVLARAGVVLGEHDILSVSPDAQVTDGMVISVTRKTVTYQTVTEAVPFETVRQGNANLARGEKRVVTQGKSGVRTYTYAVTAVEGKETGRTLVSNVITTAPVSQVVEYGTKVKRGSISSLSVSRDILVSVDGDSRGGTLWTSTGKELSYSKTITCVATAYTTENKSRKITATGTTARVGAIAVDPKVIPYGTRMYIVTADGSVVYGIATAEDCGGFSGKQIDLFFNTRSECLNFGRRTCTVYILK